MCRNGCIQLPVHIGNQVKPSSVTAITEHLSRGFHFSNTFVTSSLPFSATSSILSLAFAQQQFPCLHVFAGLVLYPGQCAYLLHLLHSFLLVSNASHPYPAYQLQRRFDITLQDRLPVSFPGRDHHLCQPAGPSVFRRWYLRLQMAPPIPSLPGTADKRTGCLF